ncbi:hypothetical protein [Nostoc sp.]|uniref:hypothetical protein n=1 Tax=Nostoc sp. TaxID=1180 RepID=UPI002FF6BA3D
MEHVKDLFQIIYFITLSLVASFTFLKARKTLLQPLRTEIFKEQLKVFNATLDLFVGKNEFELRQDYGLDILFESNIGYLMILNLPYKNIADDYLSEILTKNNTVRLSKYHDIISNGK